MKSVLITGGAGFIGSNFVHYVLEKYPSVQVLNLDKLTYAGNLDNLRDIEGDPRYQFIRGDICDKALVADVFKKFKPDVVFNFAAESHVDRSIGDPDSFIKTDIYGVYILLEASRNFGVHRFIQISTDEVYGSVEEGSSSEDDPLMPRNPYSASKAGADRLAYSYFATYNIPVIITRASNNYGPYQYPEKLIPLFTTNALDDKRLPLYGDGKNVRDWLYVRDHCEALDLILQKGKIGEVYNIGGGNERTNLEISHIILDYLNKPGDLLVFVKDRLGHDRRYSLNCDKIRALGWSPSHKFDDGIRETINWYRDNRWWWEKLKSGEYLDYYKSHYKMEL